MRRVGPCGLLRGHEGHEKKVSIFNFSCPVYLFLPLSLVWFLTRFFKLSSSLSALTERVTACVIHMAIN